MASSSLNRTRVMPIAATKKTLNSIKPLRDLEPVRDLPITHAYPGRHAVVESSDYSNLSRPAPRFGPIPSTTKHM